MINRLIYGGKVYYKVADLAQLFDVSIYKMRNAIKAHEIGTRLKGFGRAIFVLEENVAKIEINNEVKILKTEFTANPVKETKVVKEPVIDVKKSKKDKKAKQEIAENKVESSEQKMGKNATPESIEKIQEEHARLIEKSKYYSVKFFRKGKISIVHDIVEKHLGKGNNLLDSTPSDIVKVRFTVAEIEKEYAKIKDLPDVTGEVKVSELSDGFKNVELNDLSNETESTMEQQV